MSHGLLRFMRAHGQIPGPGQRPWLTGALGGALGGVAALPILERSGAIPSLVTALGLSAWAIVALYLAISAFAGALYGTIFQRAANDRRGGWLFGLSYGFLLWMLGPIALLQSVLRRPLATGVAAMGLLGANLISGLVLGGLFRPLNGLVQKRSGQPRAVGFPHTVGHNR